MTDSFMHNHQSALDSFMEDNAIRDLEDAGIYPEPDNDEIMESLFEKYEVSQSIVKDEDTVYPQIRYVIRDEDNQIVRHYWKSSWTLKKDAEQALSEIVQERFEQLPEPTGDYDD